MQPSREEFDEWLQHPVSEWVMRLVGKFAGRQRDLWASQAWEGNLDPILLTEAKTRADSYAALSESTYEDWIGIDDTGTE